MFGGRAQNTFEFPNLYQLVNVTRPMKSEFRTSRSPTPFLSLYFSMPIARPAAKPLSHLKDDLNVHVDAVSSENLWFLPFIDQVNYVQCIFLVGVLIRSAKSLFVCSQMVQHKRAFAYIWNHQKLQLVPRMLLQQLPHRISSALISYLDKIEMRAVFTSL